MRKRSNEMTPASPFQHTFTELEARRAGTRFVERVIEKADGTTIHEQRMSDGRRKMTLRVTRRANGTIIRERVVAYS